MERKGGEDMTALEQMKSSVYKSLGMLSIIPPVIATKFVVKTVDKSFKDLEKTMYKKKKKR